MERRSGGGPWQREALPKGMTLTAEQSPNANGSGEQSLQDLLPLPSGERCLKRGFGIVPYGYWGYFRLTFRAVLTDGFDGGEQARASERSERGDVLSECIQWNSMSG